VLHQTTQCLCWLFCLNFQEWDYLQPLKPWMRTWPWSYYQGKVGWQCQTIGFYCKTRSILHWSCRVREDDQGSCTSYSWSQVRNEIKKGDFILKFRYRSWAFTILKALYLCRVSRSQFLNTEEFIDAVAEELRARLSVKAKL